jgi:uncharacterized protein YsxB (DUF464 family)
MIRATVSRDEWKFRIDVTGHDEDDPSVCAGVSALTQALAMWAKDAPYCAVQEYSAGSGELHLAVCGRAESAFQVVVYGLLGLEKASPKNISVNVEKFY